MTAKNTYRWGEQEIIDFPVDSAVVVERGEFVFLAAAGDTATTGTVIPASGIADAGLAADNAAAAKAQFLGIAMTDSQASKTDGVRVATRGVYEKDFDSEQSVDILSVFEITATDAACVNSLKQGATSPVAVCVKKLISATSGLIKLLPSALVP